MRKKKEKKISKEYLYTLCVGGYYQYKVYKITDAADYTYFVAHPVLHGGSVLTEKEEEILPLLEKQVPILNDFLSKVR